jgi:hypothetical protein
VKRTTNRVVPCVSERGDLISRYGYIGTTFEIQISIDCASDFVDKCEAMANEYDIGQERY